MLLVMNSDLTMEKAKNVRRSAKSTFTRTINAGKILLDSERPTKEVRDSLEELKAVYADLAAKHEEYAMFLKDEEYPEAEMWMEECTVRYVEFSMRLRDYCDASGQDKDQDKQPESAAGAVDTNEQAIHGSLEELQVAVDTETKKNEQSNAVRPKNVPGKPFLMKHEKPKMPTFHGDVRKYFIFVKSGFPACRRKALLRTRRHNDPAFMFGP